MVCAYCDKKHLEFETVQGGTVFLSIALIAYMIDRIFGEFIFIRHPVVLMGDFITAFQKKFYAQTIKRGFWLVVWLLAVVLAIIYPPRQIHH